MKKGLSITLLLGALLTPISAAAVDLAKQAKAYVADRGVSVVIANTLDGQQALVQMTGLDSERDGVVFLTDRVSLDNRGEAYRAKVDGKRINLVLRGRGWRGDYLTVFPPGGGESDLAFDEDEVVSTDDLKAIYLSQMEEGVQDDLARFNRTKHEAEAMKALAGLDAEASEACGSAIATTIDWSTVDDALLMNVSVNGYCGVVASEMGSLCEKSPHFKSRSGELEAIECSFGERLNIRNDRSRISFTTHKEEPNQQVFVRSYFRNM